MTNFYAAIFFGRGSKVQVSLALAPPVLYKKVDTAP
jgi:hypothetical protein